MLIDLNDYRPNNESYEHFLLKQIGRAFLFQNKCRFVGCEVDIHGNDQSPFGSKRVSDVVGLFLQQKQDDKARAVYNDIQSRAIQLARREGSDVVFSSGNNYYFRSFYNLPAPQKYVIEATIAHFFERACLEMGFHKDVHLKLKSPYKDFYVCRSVESKVSLSDFHNGFSMIAEYSYLIAPVGIIPKNEVPAKVGLLEFDFQKFEQTRDWQKSLTVSKKPKKKYDSSFLQNGGFDEEKHRDFCKELMYKIAQQNTEETVNWNILLRQIKEGYTGEFWNIHTFAYKVGDVTPLGIVVDRRIGKNPNFDSKVHSFYGSVPRETEFYKMVVPGKGMTKWIAIDKIN